MSDTIGMFRGSGTATSAAFKSAGGNYLFTVYGTHAGGTTTLEQRLPGTSTTRHVFYSFTSSGVGNV